MRSSSRNSFKVPQEYLRQFRSFFSARTIRIIERGLRVGHRCSLSDTRLYMLSSFFRYHFVVDTLAISSLESALKARVGMLPEVLDRASIMAFITEMQRLMIVEAEKFKSRVVDPTVREYRVANSARYLQEFQGIPEAIAIETANALYDANPAGYWSTKVYKQQIHHMLSRAHADAGRPGVRFFSCEYDYVLGVDVPMFGTRLERIHGKAVPAFYSRYRELSRLSVPADEEISEDATSALAVATAVQDDDVEDSKQAAGEEQAVTLVDRVDDDRSVSSLSSMHLSVVSMHRPVRLRLPHALLRSDNPFIRLAIQIDRRDSHIYHMYDRIAGLLLSGLGFVKDVRCLYEGEARHQARAGLRQLLKKAIPLARDKERPGLSIVEIYLTSYVSDVEAKLKSSGGLQQYKILLEALRTCAQSLSKIASQNARPAMPIYQAWVEELLANAEVLELDDTKLSPCLYFIKAPHPVSDQAMSGVLASD